MRSVPGAIATGSQRIPRIDIAIMVNPVATAPGTDSITPTESVFQRSLMIELPRSSIPFN